MSHQPARPRRDDEARITFDANLIITSWDTQAEHLFGWTESEAVGQPMWDVLPGDGDRAARLRAVRTGHWHGIVVVADKYNEHVAIESSVTAEQPDANGEVAYQASIRQLAESDLYRRRRAAEQDGPVDLHRLGDKR